MVGRHLCLKSCWLGDLHLLLHSLIGLCILWYHFLDVRRLELATDFISRFFHRFQANLYRKLAVAEKRVRGAAAYKSQ